MQNRTAIWAAVVLGSTAVTLGGAPPPQSRVVTATIVPSSNKAPFVVLRPSQSDTSCWKSLKASSKSGQFAATVPADNASCTSNAAAVFGFARRAFWANLSATGADATLNASPHIVPLNVHVFLSPSVGSSAATKKVLGWIAKANTIFGDKNPVGITFIDSDGLTIHPNSANNMGVGTSCDNQGPMATAAPFFTTSALTVYVVPSLGSSMLGWRCPTPPNLIYMSYSQAVTGTLAHEIGHALLGLNHLGDGALFAHNLMVDRSEVVLEQKTSWQFDSVTAGQAVRALMDKSSWLNNSGVVLVPPSAPMIDCSQKNKCPDPFLRWK